MAKVGDILGRYTLVRRVASGSIGELYIAAPKMGNGFGAPIAIKILHPELARNVAFIQAVIDESRTSTQLAHPNIVSVFDFAEDSGSYFLALEYVHGITVQHLLMRSSAMKQKLDVAAAMFIAIELCRACAYLHGIKNARGEPATFIHRDITPENVLLSLQGEVKLKGFGMARLKSRLNLSKGGAAKAKPVYAAPEVLRQRDVDERADVFSIGAILYEVLAGEHPCQSALGQEALLRFEEKRVARPSTLNRAIVPELEEIIMRALEPQPAERWISAQAMRNAILSLAFSDPTYKKSFQQVGGELGRLVAESEPQLIATRAPSRSRLIAPSGGGERVPEQSSTVPDPRPNRDASPFDPENSEVSDPSQPGFNDLTTARTMTPAALLRAESPTSVSDDYFQYIDFNESSESTFRTLSEQRLWRSLSSSGVALAALGAHHEERTVGRASLPAVAAEQALSATNPPELEAATEGRLGTPAALAKTLENDLDEITASSKWSSNRGPRDSGPHSHNGREPSHLPTISAPEEAGPKLSWPAVQASLSQSQSGTIRVPGKVMDAIVSQVPESLAQPSAQRASSLGPTATAPSPASGPAQATPGSLLLPSLVVSATKHEVPTSASGAETTNLKLSELAHNDTATWPVSPPPASPDTAAKSPDRSGDRVDPSAMRLWVGMAFGASIFALAIAIAIVVPRLRTPTLHITTIPPGAQVTLNGRRFASPTPLVVEVEPSSPLDLDFELEGYEPASQQIEGLPRGENRTFAMTLQRLKPELHIGPVVGQVFVNGNEIGSGTRVPLGALELDKPIVLLVKANGYKPFRRTFALGSQVPAHVQVTLSRD